MFGEIKSESLERMNKVLTLRHFDIVYDELVSITAYDKYVVQLIDRVSTNTDIKQATIDMMREAAQEIREYRYCGITVEVKSKCFTCGMKLTGSYIESVNSPDTVYCGEDCFVQMGLSKGHTSHTGYSMPLAQKNYIKTITWFDDPETKIRRKICKLLCMDFIPDLTTPSSMVTILKRLEDMAACFDLMYRPDEPDDGWFCEIEGLLLDGEIYNISSWDVDKKVSPSPPEALLKALEELVRVKEFREEE